MYREIDACRVCAGALVEVLSYAPMPLVNSYCEPGPHECDHYPLTLMACAQCGLMQIKEEVAPTKLYPGHYSYVPSASQTMLAHFDNLAARYAKPGAFMIDIGSNDGSLLAPFARRGCRVLGVDPARNLVELANERGLPSIAAMFDEGLAEEVLGSHGQADIVTATNVVANVHLMLSFLRGARRLLKADGVFVMETPNFLSLMDLGSYDSVYHEHMAYFTPATVEKALSVAGLEIVALEQVPIHGGSLRATAKAARARAQKGEGAAPDLGGFIRRVGGIRDALQRFLRRASQEGKSVVGYTVPAKATVLLTQAGINPSWMEYAVDDNPLKQGKLLPGLHIEIRPPETLDQGSAPDYLLVQAWNFRDEILPKLHRYMVAGARAVIPIPALEIVSSSWPK